MLGSFGIKKKKCEISNFPRKNNYSLAIFLLSACSSEMLNHYLIEPPLATNLAKKNIFWFSNGCLPTQLLMIADVDGVVSLGEIKPKSASVQWVEQGQSLPPTSLTTARSNSLAIATRDMLQITPRGGHPAIQRLAFYCCMWVSTQSYQASESMIKQSAAFTMKRPLSPMPRISSVST